MSGRLLNINNTSGTLYFSPSAEFSSNANKINLYSKKDINFITDKTTISLTPNKFISKTQNNQLISINNSNEDAILLKNEEYEGGITEESGKAGHHIISKGSINLNAIKGDINIGSIILDLDNNNEFENTDDNNLTNNITLESLHKITLNTEDFYTIASDNIQFISESGQIEFGNKINSPFIKINNNKLLINSNGNIHNDNCDLDINNNYILDINLENNKYLLKNDNQDGIKINSSYQDINPILALNNDITNNNINLGMSTYSNNENTFYAYIENKYIYINYLYYELIKTTPSNLIYFEKDKKEITINKNDFECNISSIFQSSNFQIKVSIIEPTFISYSNIHQYISKQYKIEIVENNQFIYYTYNLNDRKNIDNSNDKNNPDCKGDNNKFKIQKKSEIDGYINIEFPVEKGYNIGDYWIFEIVYKLKTDNYNDKDLSLQRCYFIDKKQETKNNISYLSTLNNTDLHLKTNSYPRIKLHNQGGISISTNQCSSPHTFNLDTNLEKRNHVLTNIINYDLQYTQYNGYFIVYEYKIDDNYSNIILERYLEEGQIDYNFKKIQVNNNQDGLHQNPNITYLNHEDDNYIITWSKYNSNSNSYNLYYQIFINNKPIKLFSIPIGITFNDDNNLNLNTIVINDNTILITWSGEDNNLHNYSIYGILVDYRGNIIKSRFQISNNTENSYYNPQPYRINNEEYIIFYQEKQQSQDNIDNVYIYKNKYKYININKNVGNIEEIYLFSSYSPINILYTTDEYGETYIYILFNDNLTTSNYKQYCDEELYIFHDKNSKTKNLYQIDDDCKIKNLNQIEDDYKYKIKKIEKNIIYLDDEENQNHNYNDIFNQGDTVKIYNGKYDSVFVNTSKIISIDNNKLIFDNTSSFNINLLEYTLDSNKLRLDCIEPCIISELQNDLTSNYQLETIKNTNSNDSTLFIITCIVNKYNIHYLLLNNEHNEIKQYSINDFSNYEKKDLKLLKLKSSLLYSWIENNNLIVKHIDSITPTLNLYDHIKYNKSRNNLIIGGSDNSKEYKKLLLNSTLHINGSKSSIFKIIDKNYTPTFDDNIIYVVSVLNNIIITLDNNESFYGIIYTIKLIRGKNNNVIITTSSDSSLIDGKKNIILNKEYEKVTIQYTGFHWFII